MGRTKPVVPVDEVVIDQIVLARILQHASSEMVLVGGQALAFWMLRFGIGVRHGGGAQALAGVTTDADFLGSMEDALALARGLNARFLASDKRSMSALVGQIRIGTSGGGDYNVDVLHKIFDVGGLRSAAAFTRRARARSAVVQIEGAAEIRILHPVDVLGSRIQNVAGLTASKGPHTVTQARWAVKVAKQAMVLLVRRGEVGTDRPGALAAEIFRLALSRAGRIAWQHHGIEAFDAIPFALMRRKLPGFAVQEEKMRKSMQEHGRLTGSATASR
jgi:hypothetical protein